MGYQIATWADGFARWHGKATFTAPPTGKEYVKAYQATRRAIRAEIVARETKTDGSKPARLTYVYVNSERDPITNAEISFTLAEK